MLSCEYIMSSWSARRSNSLQVASSEPVAKAFPFGKNCTRGCTNLNTESIPECGNVQNTLDTYADGVNIRNMAGEGLSAHAVSNVPQLGGGVTGTRYEGLGVRAEWQTHHITGVACEVCGLLACFDIPQCTGESPQLVMLLQIIYFKQIKKKNNAKSTLSVYLPLFNIANTVFTQISEHKFSTHHVVSPELVTIWLSLRKRQQDKYPAKTDRYYETYSITSIFAFH